MATAPTSKALDEKLNRLLKKDPTTAPLDLATEILGSYTSIASLKKDITWVLALYAADRQRLFTLEPKKPTAKEQTLIARRLAHETWVAGLPYGHPESHVKLPNQTLRVWKTLDASEHDACAQMLRERGANCYRQAELHDQAALRLRGAIPAI
jgi:hypothetical protein